ncbi:DUF986 family protein [Actinobacillus equuli]|uniref:DUF986 family protein n=1 Tax=Actinobacillus equuli TaxID=718 RepID=UPI002441D8C7|nr:DUF986 family protein [Actinobacillus equuli]WGE52879.1 DUF986 family protein [Actinobacillus equuli subsp. haemolyticus]WGE59098.1 DUF986 family protein [Actinobacillus equuli subsp. haemolyticus]WGE60302.1 DUF986 family protein [Actinobacillus equuli subsp. haemolyticus]WGE73323.1 DUF986 family protein [Actinobacillus equuli subsp. haemolyticus]WGE85529.1 DUF986 family protein [Actinobacillus equuli subsp. haemolyticus]
MTNIILLIGITAVLAFAIYDQVIMPKLKGETKLVVQLQRQVKGDAWILIGLIALTMVYGVQNGIESLTIYLLAFSIILCVYVTFLRSPRLLLKEQGFFFANVFFEYANINQINLAQSQIIVIDLKSGRRLLVRIQTPEDVEKVVNFFGGYKK